MSRHALVLTALLLSGCPTTLACPPGMIIDGTACVPEGDAGLADVGIGTDALEPAPDVPANDAPVDACPTHTYYLDADHDGFGITTMTMTACTAPTGFSDTSGDCDDMHAEAHPMAAEVCDMAMLDENCDGTRNEGCECFIGQTRACPGESEVGECIAGTQACDAGRWATTCTGTVRPMLERCDGLDNDCDTMVDGPAADGTCGTWPNGSPRCLTGGICGGVCGAGYADCSAGAGCETMLGTTSACSACGDTCAWRCGSASVGCDDPTALTMGVGGARQTVLAITTRDGLYGWGDNANGEVLGVTGASVARSTRTTGLTGRLLDVAIGVDHACAIVASGTATSGTVYCWGGNAHGQLGDGTTTARLTRVSTGITNAVEIAASSQSTCARLASGSVQCWGQNALSELGDGTTTDRTRPVTVTGVTGVSHLDGGSFRFCASTASGSVACWGNGRALESTAMGAGRSVLALAVGAQHACAITSGTTLGSTAVVCWGEGSGGELGNGALADSSAPVSVAAVAAGATPIAIGAGSAHTCVVGSDGGVRCWGSNASGQLGDGSTATRAVPNPVSSLSDVVAVDGGQGSTCALQSSGSIRCWGANGASELGDGSTTGRLAPVLVLAPL